MNTRDEIALARVINVPNRDLDHWAFTDLRKTADATGLPMFQVSFNDLNQHKTREAPHVLIKCKEIQYDLV